MKTEQQADDLLHFRGQKHSQRLTRETRFHHFVLRHRLERQAVQGKIPARLASTKNR
jgi:hypothetical protein